MNTYGEPSVRFVVETVRVTTQASPGETELDEQLATDMLVAATPFMKYWASAKFTEVAPTFLNVTTNGPPTGKL